MIFVAVAAVAAVVETARVPCMFLLLFVVLSSSRRLTILFSVAVLFGYLLLIIYFSLRIEIKLN